jgi:1-acyl-sn-glycerol-3-phosphate acyltransferase
MLSLPALIGAVWWVLTRPIVIVLGLLVRVPLGLWSFWERSVDRFGFRPPRLSRPVVRLAHTLTPAVARRLWRIEGMEFDPDGLEALRALKGQRVVLCPNHPTGLDPLVLFRLSSLLGEDFSYLACQEAFANPLKGWLMQRVGCYSIIRGTADRDSFRMSRELLAAGERWVVMFPEGEACGQNDIVMPFQEGIAQMAFWALEDLAKKGESPRTDAVRPRTDAVRPPLYLVPVALKYAYKRDMRPEFDRVLARLERKLEVAAPSRDLDPRVLYERLRHIGEAVLVAIEKKQGLRPAKDASLDDRVQQVKEHLVSRVAASLGVKLRSGQPLLDRVRTLFNAADRLVHDEPAGSDYERELHRRRQEEVRPLYDDLARVLRFIATYDGYVRETMTAERFAEVLVRLEWEVSGKEDWLAPREVSVKLGEPLNVAEHWEAYRQDKRNVVTGVTMQLEGSVRLLLGSMSGGAGLLAAEEAGRP